MQAKIIDFASDTITKQLQKIDKDDVKKIMSNMTGAKAQTKPPVQTSSPAQTSSTKVNDVKKPKEGVSSSDEYCAFLENEFSFSSPSSSLRNDKKGDEKDGLLKKNGE